MGNRTRSRAQALPATQRFSLSHAPGWEADAIRQFMEIAVAAAEDKSHAAAVAAVKEVVRLRCRLDDQHVAALIAATTDPIARAGLMRDAAAAAGSHVAAGAADREVHARAIQAEQARREAERERLEHLADADIMAMIEEFAADLKALDAARLAHFLLARPDVATLPVQIEAR